MQKTDFKTRNPDFITRVQNSFDRQAFMGFLGAELAEIAPGYAEIRLPYQSGLTQQHGFFHGGVIGTLADVTGGYAAFSLMAAQDSILTVEYKVNMLAPAVGEALLARGHVVRAGRKISVAHTDVYSVQDGIEKLVATSLATLMTMADLADDSVGK